jgi:hypothetical protein
VQPPHILLICGNLQKVPRNLAHVLDQPALAMIQAEINRNVRQLFALGESHFTFAKNQPPRYWRQKVSRCYYGAYNVSRALRLASTGDYSTESDDHKRIGQLPDGMPDRDRFSNGLKGLREDRNSCDYDHTISESHLIMVPDDAIQLVGEFVNVADKYLIDRGL